MSGDLDQRRFARVHRGVDPPCQQPGQSLGIGVAFEPVHGAGHINVKSGHQRWEQGFAYLYRLQRQIEQLERLRA